MNGSPAIRRTTRCRLGLLDDELGARRRGSAAGRPRRSRRRRPRRRRQNASTSAACSGDLGHHDVGGAEQVDGAHGQQLGVARAAADERHEPDRQPDLVGGRRGSGRASAARRSRAVVDGGLRRLGAHSRLLAAVVGCVLLLVLLVMTPAPRSGPRPVVQHLLGQRPADHSASSGGPVAERRTARCRRWTAPPRAATARRRRRPRRPRPAHPTGAEQPASRAASTARSASTAARVPRVVQRGAHRVDEVGVARRGTRPPAHPARARAASAAGRASRSPRRAGRAGPARPGPGPRRPTRRRRPCRSGCPRCRGSPTTSKPRPSAWSCAARRGDPVPTRAPAGSSPRVSPSRATSTSRGSSRSGHGGQRDQSGCGAVGQVLERVHGDVDVAAQQRVAQGADEDAGAADAGERRGGDVAVRC